ncbi:hypothetical protein AB6A40_005737 [Gnathostoma spinigerum]|uniref:Pentatricopeptide repeat-containing protein n=1 Tax=Gnathostoma spinigerum TaxID=75299 RepID=A0ABD6EGA9_9BILA
MQTVNGGHLEYFEYGTSMIIYNRIATVTNNEHFRTALKFLLFRIAMVMGDSRKMEHFAKEISLLPGSDQNLISFLMSVFHGNFSSAEEHLKEIAARGDKITNTNNTAVCKMYNGGATAAYDLLRKYDGSHCKPSIMNLMTIADLIVCDSTKEKIAFFTDNLDRLLDMSDLLTLKVSK